MSDTPHKWTPKQCEILAGASRNPDGIRCRGAGAQAAAVSLEKGGLGRFASIPSASRFYINPAGRARLHEATVHADSEAGRYLGNANEASGRGNAEKSRNLMQRCQEWMDAANDLRGNGGEP